MKEKPFGLISLIDSRCGVEMPFGLNSPMCSRFGMKEKPFGLISLIGSRCGVEMPFGLILHM